MAKKGNGDGLFDLTDKNSQSNAFIITLIIGIVSLVLLIYFLRRRTVSRRLVCIVGLSDAGKTLIFSQLIYEKAKETYTTMKANVESYLVPNKKSLTLVDVPGYERLRQQCFDSYKGTSRGVVFVLDSLSLTKDIRDVAEYLYNVLTDPIVMSNKLPVLVLCNKQDHARAKGPQVIQAQLEKEMNLLRNTKTNQLEAISGDSSRNAVFLGRQGKDFEFTDVRPIRVEFGPASAENGDLDYLKNWLQSVA